MIRNFSDGDIVTSGDHFVTGKEETRQACISRLRLFLGEYFLDATDGTPWFQSILGKASRDIAEANIKQRLLGTRGVIAINSFEMTSDTKERKISVVATLTDINNEQFEFLFEKET
ncbi:hypothetical protein [Klebsiella oxytoca]|uniref:hypothetical protein n=1 Tax=Klebsiella oxytoca TaxID=571 RepID=UPI0019190684|nr:hypothetical protein [Klebsiella oxytoca]ELR9657053.1 hypothetical protein [Klebsiella oxytoca]HAT1590639.1 hypothetical protein [Klebsiella oxytoca]HCD7233901.1 hypothetical protein [Klebsiella oxytoca]